MLDTNVVISAVLRPEGLPARVVAHAFAEGTVLVSDALLTELRTRLARPKFDRYVSAEDREALVALFARRGTLIDVATVVTDSPDPDDNAVLALALDGRADVVVTGDRRHVLPLHPYRGIPVLSPRDFAERVGVV